MGLGSYELMMGINNNILDTISCVGFGTVLLLMMNKLQREDAHLQTATYTKVVGLS